GIVKHKAHTEVRTGRELGLLAKYHLEILDRPPISRQYAIPYCRARASFVALLRVPEINAAITVKIRGDHHIKQAALIAGIHLRYSFQRIRQLTAAPQAQAAGPFSDQNPLVIWKKRQCPRVLKPLHDRRSLCGRRYRLHLACKSSICRDDRAAHGQDSGQHCARPQQPGPNDPPRKFRIDFHLTALPLHWSAIPTPLRWFSQSQL